MPAPLNLIDLLKGMPAGSPDAPANANWSAVDDQFLAPNPVPGEAAKKPAKKKAVAAAPAPQPQASDDDSPDAASAFDQAYQQIMGGRQADQEALKQKLAQAQASQPSGMSIVDMKPMLAYADSLSGGKSAQSYTAPTLLADNRALQQKLQEQIEKGGHDLSSDELNYLKMKSLEGTRYDANDARREAAQGIAGYRAQSLGLREDALGLRAGDKLTGDSMITGINTQNNSLNKALRTLNESAVITPQMLSEIESDVASALSGKGAATDHLRSSVEMANWDRMLTNMHQRIASSPRGINEPQYVQYLGGVIKRLQDANNINLKEQVARKTAGLGNVGSAKVRSIVNARAASLNGGGSGMITVSNGSETLHIPAEDLPHAKADGYDEVDQ